MLFNKDKRIKETIPGLNGKYVLYVGSTGKDLFPMDSSSWESLRDSFRRIGYKFIFIPELIEELSGQMSEYLFPGFVMPDADSVFNHLQDIIGIQGKTGFLYKRHSYTYFRDLSKPGTDIGESISDLLELLSKPRFPKFFVEQTLDICDKYEREEDEPTLQKNKRKPSSEIPLPPQQDSDVLFRVDEQDGQTRFRKSSGDTRFRAIERDPLPWSESDLDAETVSLLLGIRKFLKDRNLSLEELEVLLGYTVKLSHLRIDLNGRVFLVDYDNREVKMDHLTKMTYLFFLRHPEGIRMKEVSNYQEELLHLYLRITGRDDLDKIKASIVRHTDPYGPNLNTSSSRIRTAFRDLVGEKVAKYYCLEGKKGEPYSIPIDRDYVIWEYPE